MRGQNQKKTNEANDFKQSTWTEYRKDKQKTKKKFKIILRD